MEINQLYLKKESLKKIKEVFHSSEWLPSVKLPKFLNKQEYNKIKYSIEKLKYIKIKKPIHCQYEKANITKEIRSLLDSKDFKELIKKITGKSIKNIKGEIRKFTWKDHTLIHDEQEKPGYDLILEFTDNWKESFGGYTAYTNGLGNSSIIYPEENTLNIIQRKKGIQRFIKYINNKAKNKYRYAVFATTTNKRM